MGVPRVNKSYCVFWEASVARCGVSSGMSCSCCLGWTAYWSRCGADIASSIGGVDVGATCAVCSCGQGGACWRLFGSSCWLAASPCLRWRISAILKRTMCCEEGVNIPVNKLWNTLWTNQLGTWWTTVWNTLWKTVKRFVKRLMKNVSEIRCETLNDKPSEKTQWNDSKTTLWMFAWICSLRILLYLY